MSSRSQSSIDEASSNAVCGFRPERADGADVGYVVAWTKRKTLTCKMV
jgi:hypothetical protein